MSNLYQKQPLTAAEEAILQADIDRLNQGTFESETEIRAARANRGSYTEGPLGDLYRHAFDMKCGRTSAAGFDVSLGNKNVTGTYRSAAATKNKDGSMDVGTTSIDAPNGKPTQPESRTVNGLPLIEQIPSGPLRVRMSSESTPETKQRRQAEIDAEKAEHERYLRSKQGIQTLPSKR